MHRQLAVQRLAELRLVGTRFRVAAIRACRLGLPGHLLGFLAVLRPDQAAIDDAAARFTVG